MLKHIPVPLDSQLLLGCNTADDAALYRLNPKQILIATTDFFMPIIDDPFGFGRIAAANALSDVYAMGGKPILALNILGMPTAKVPIEVIEQVSAGGLATCERADVAVAGGHSIDCNEAFYGLAVCGLAHPDHIKQNSTAQPGDTLVLGKPLGIGILAAAYQQNKLNAAGYESLITYASQLNSVGAELATLDTVHAMTDITGFGLLGHLLEMCNASKLQAILHADDIPLIDQAVGLAADGVISAAGTRNWEHYRYDVGLSDKAKNIQPLLTDPQTNGGLLVACAAEAVAQVQDLFIRNGFKEVATIGQLNNEDTPKVGVI